MAPLGWTDPVNAPAPAPAPEQPGSDSGSFTGSGLKPTRHRCHT